MPAATLPPVLSISGTSELFPRFHVKLRLEVFWVRVKYLFGPGAVAQGVLSWQFQL